MLFICTYNQFVLQKYTSQSTCSTRDRQKRGSGGRFMTCELRMHSKIVKKVTFSIFKNHSILKVISSSKLILKYFIIRKLLKWYCNKLFSCELPSSLMSKISPHAQLWTRWPRSVCPGILFNVLSKYYSRTSSISLKLK